MRNVWLEKREESRSRLVESRFRIRLFKIHDDGAVTTWYCKNHYYNGYCAIIDKATHVDGYTIYLDNKAWRHMQFKEPISLQEGDNLFATGLNLIDVIKKVDNGCHYQPVQRKVKIRKATK